MSTLSVLYDVARERSRQDKLRDEGRFQFTAADSPGLTNDQRLSMLTEELGEVAREVQNLSGAVNDGEADAAHLYTELIQVAAIAVAFAEAHATHPDKRSEDGSGLREHSPNGSLTSRSPVNDQSATAASSTPIPRFGRGA